MLQPLTLLRALLILIVQISELKDLFEKDFGVTAVVVTLQAGEIDPQVQMNAVITDFVHKYDGDDEEHLLVVYYSGHGLIAHTRPNELIFTRYGGALRSEEDDNETRKYRHRANWSQAERTLREQACSDTLVILDCCFAGHALTDFRRSSSGRCYEMMVATGWKGFTLTPGPGSYTAILIESLKELRRDGGSFSTWELAQTIMKKQQWMGKSNLHPVLLGGGGRHIILAPSVKSVEGG